MAIILEEQLLNLDLLIYAKDETFFGSYFIISLYDYYTI